MGTQELQREARNDLFRAYNRITQEAGDKLPHLLSGRIYLLGIHAISNPDLDIAIANQWLGFIQGILYSHGLINSQDTEADSKEISFMSYGDIEVGLPQFAT